MSVKSASTAPRSHSLPMAHQPLLAGLGLFQASSCSVVDCLLLDHGPGKDFGRESNFVRRGQNSVSLGQNFVSHGQNSVNDGQSLVSDGPSLPVWEKTLSITNKTQSVMNRVFSVTDKTLSATDKTRSVRDKTVSPPDKTLSVVQKPDCWAETTVSASYLPISDRQWVYSKTNQTQNAIQTHSNPWHQFLLPGTELTA